MKFIKYPQQMFTVGEAFSYGGGILKVGYTFDVCTDGCEKVCVCVDDCECVKVAGVCTPGEGCEHFESLCALLNTENTDASVGNDITKELGSGKTVYLTHRSDSSLSASYTIDVVEDKEYKVTFSIITINGYEGSISKWVEVDAATHTLAGAKLEAIPNQENGYIC